MPDREYRIRIATISDPTGLKEAQQGLDQYKDTGVRAHQEVGKEAEQLEVKHKDLRAAVKGLHMEFPALSQIARLALNPIVAIVTAITFAFKLFHERMEALKQLLSSFELPEVTPEKVGHVAAGAEAWNKYADAIKKSGESFHSVDAASDRATEKIKQQLDEEKKLLAASKGRELANLESKRGSMSAEQYESAKTAIEQRYSDAGLAAEQRAETATFTQRARRASELAVDSQGKMKAAGRIKVASAEDDQQTEADMRKQAAVAEKEIEERRARLAELNAYEAGEMGFLEEHKYSAKFVKNYGLGTSTGEVRKAEQEGIERAQIPINRLNEFLRRLPGRNKLRASRSELEDAAAKEAGEAAGLDEAFPGDLAALQRKQAMDNRVRSLERSPFGAAATGDLRSAISTAQSLEQHKQVSLESKQQLQNVASEIAGHRVTLETAVSMMDFSAKSIGNFTNTAVRLANAMSTMGAAISQLDARLTNFERQTNFRFHSAVNP